MGCRSIPAQRGKHKNEEEKEKKRHWREKTDAPGQWPRLQFLRHLQRDVEAGHQVLIFPFQLPAAGGAPLLPWATWRSLENRNRKNRFAPQIEITRLGYAMSFLPESCSEMLYRQLSSPWERYAVAKRACCPWQWWIALWPLRR